MTSAGIPTALVFFVLGPARLSYRRWSGSVLRRWLRRLLPVCWPGCWGRGRVMLVASFGLRGGARRRHAEFFFAGVDLVLVAGVFGETGADSGAGARRRERVGVQLCGGGHCH